MEQPIFVPLLASFLLVDSERNDRFISIFITLGLEMNPKFLTVF